ncbi:MAG: hypothetical protein JWM32_1802 [Verrucomicrobia bacterium]|nr:hypothetical protein [Verrucomicrobiota bacterium]
MGDTEENYRDRWLDRFLATYVMLGVGSGIAVSLAIGVRHPGNVRLVAAVCGLSALQAVLILVMFHRLRTVYERLAFRPPPSNASEAKVFNAHDTPQFAEAKQNLRRVSERIIHVTMALQAVLLWLAWA